MRNRRKKIIYSVLACLLLLCACKDELDLTAEYRDTTVVYCLLNPEDPVHHVRIHRAFLADGNVLESVKLADSSVYDPGDIHVTLYAIGSYGNILKTIPFTYVPGAVTEPGLFHPAGIMLYRSTEPISPGKYRLEVIHSALNKQMTAETDIMSGFSWIDPTQPKVSFINPNGLNLKWSRANPDWLYQPEIIFHWTEVNLQTGETAPDSAVWNFHYLTTQDLPPANQLPFIERNLSYPGFYTFVASEVPEKSGVKRVIGPVVFKLYAGTRAVDEFLILNAPSTGLIQEKPVYSNIKNGVGIFAGRPSVTHEAALAEPSQDSLIDGQYTAHLGFSKN